MEFTGDYYKCMDCCHVWDYNDTHCPECGSQDFETINSNEVIMTAESCDEKEQTRIAEMLKSHGD